jgi:hypothetical protein
MATISTKSQITREHETIRRWAEEREGVPATVSSTKRPGEIGILRIMFPKTGKDDNLQQISWEDFFRKFDENELQFLYQEKTNDGQLSRFFKFVRAKK